jgi:hypothetical protein
VESGKADLQGSLILSPVAQMGHWIFVLVQKKTVMPKKKVFAVRNLKNCLPNLPLETGRAKKKIKVFLSKQFCTSCLVMLVTKRDRWESTSQRASNV